MSRAARSQRFSRVAAHPEPVASFECPGCHWTFGFPELLATHVLHCEPAKARALPKDDDFEGWRALAEQMKRAAIEAQARGRTDEAEAYFRRSDAAAACAEKARAAQGATP